MLQSPLYMHLVDGVPVNTNGRKPPAGKTRLGIQNLLVLKEGMLTQLADRKTSSTTHFYTNIRDMFYKLAGINRHLFYFDTPPSSKPRNSAHYLVKAWDKPKFPLHWEGWLGAPTYARIPRSALVRFLDEAATTTEMVGLFMNVSGEIVVLGMPRSYLSRYEIALQSAALMESLFI